MQTQVLDASVTFHPQRFITPLVISSGSIEEIVEARALVRVRVGGREAQGRGSIYLSDLWAWPDPEYAHPQREKTLKDLCQRIAEDLSNLTGSESAHPLELGLRLHHGVCHAMQDSFAMVPTLARSMCLSPFDAAIHDAAGIATGRSAFEFYREPAPIPSADSMFPGVGACAVINQMLRPSPRLEFPAWLIVGKNDDLQTTMRPWVLERGYRCFKLKLMGRDTTQDVARTVEVHRALRNWGLSDVRLSVDSNEANPDAASVLEYLTCLRDDDPAAFAALDYLEQPTGRDILRNQFNWSGVSALKPVLLDEGLTDLELLEEARRQGWSGLALKTCKGHSFALVAAAWARQRGMLLSLQDLTNPGLSLMHAALMAAHLPTINGVELNSPQFTPGANREWTEKHPNLFEPRDGQHRLKSPRPAGLGSGLLY